MKITIDITSEKYIDNMRERFDSRLMLGKERFIGWCIGGFFTVSYYSGKEFGRRNYPIANKAIGIIKNNDGNTVVHYCSFQGLTDPISLALLFVLSFFIFVKIGTPSPALFALGWITAVAVLTWICTKLSAAGQEGIARLDDFLLHSVANK